MLEIPVKIILWLGGSPQHGELSSRVTALERLRATTLWKLKEVILPQKPRGLTIPNMRPDHLYSAI